MVMLSKFRVKVGVLDMNLTYKKRLSCDNFCLNPKVSKTLYEEEQGKKIFRKPR